MNKETNIKNAVGILAVVMTMGIAPITNAIDSSEAAKRSQQSIDLSDDKILIGQKINAKWHEDIRGFEILHQDRSYPENTSVELSGQSNLFLEGLGSSDISGMVGEHLTGNDIAQQVIAKGCKHCVSGKVHHTRKQFRRKPNSFFGYR